MTHAIERTSPTGPGMKFIGRCIKCGQENLMMKDALVDCPADGVVSDTQALLDILDEAARRKEQQG